MEQYNSYQQNQELGWDAEIRKESEFILLEPGDYDFIVESFERSRYEGSTKMSACNCADLSLRIDTANGPVTIKHKLFLHQKTEWALSAFFRCIGQKKKDEPLRMNWNAVPGSKGRCKIGHKNYNDNEYNEIKKFYPADEVTPGMQQPQGYAQQTAPQYNPSKRW